MLNLTPNPIFQRRPDDAQDELHTRTALVRKSEKRQMIEATQSRNALKEISALPDVEESLHVIARGNFPLFAAIPAVLQLAHPAIITELGITTLSFSKSNATALFDLLDTRKIQRVAIIASVYFERQSPAEWNMMHDGLLARHQQIAALRSHSKIITMRLSDDRCFVIESSANLRSCRNLEQFCLTQSSPLHDFHFGWIQKVIANAK